MNKSALEKIVKLPSGASLEQLGRLLHSSVQVAVRANYAWLRYSGTDPEVRSIVRLLQGSHYQLNDHGRLIPDGASVATERLPALDWRPIRESLELQLPVAAMSGSLKTTLLPKLELRRGGEERPASAALIELHTLLDWCERVPQFRLNKLTACVAAEQVLVLGNPLPSVPCQFLCVEGGLITPVGMTWVPHLESELVLEHFDIQSGELLLWMATEEWSSVPRTLLRPLQLAGLRAYAAGCNGGLGANL